MDGANPHLNTQAECAFDVRAAPRCHQAVGEHGGPTEDDLMMPWELVFARASLISVNICGLWPSKMVPSTVVSGFCRITMWGLLVPPRCVEIRHNLQSQDRRARNPRAQKDPKPSMASSVLSTARAILLGVVGWGSGRSKTRARSWPLRERLKRYVLAEESKRLGRLDQPFWGLERTSSTFTGSKASPMNVKRPSSLSLLEMMSSNVNE